MPHDALRMIEYGDTPSILVVTDSAEGAERARAAAAGAGCRVCDSIPVEGAAERLDRQIGADAILIDVREDHGAELDRLVQRADSQARSGRRPSVVVTPFELVDRIFAHAWHPDVHHLCDPSEAQQTAALAIASMRPPARLYDVGKKNGASRLQQISEEIGRIASLLAALSEEEALGEAPTPGEDEAESELKSSTIRAMIRARRLRDQYFPAGLFADPAWDMLLDLMAARLDRQRVAVSSLCIAAAVPATTALRWIKTLADHGLFVRTADPQDGRRVFIELSDRAAAQLAAYLKAVQRLSPLAV